MNFDQKIATIRIFKKKERKKNAVNVSEIKNNLKQILRLKKKMFYFSLFYISYEHL